LQRELEQALTEDSGSIEAYLIPPKAGQGIEGVGWDVEIAGALQEASSVFALDMRRQSGLSYFLKYPA
jgi:hypothetical protein